MTTRLRILSVLAFGLCAGLSATVAANGYPTGVMQPGLYKVEGRMLNAQAGSGPGARQAVQNFQAAMASELAARQICFTPAMTRTGASALLTEGRQGCSFDASREDSSGFEGRLRCPGDADSGQPSTVSGRIFDAGADYSITASGPMMVGETMSRIDFRVRYVATRIGECR
mgnify:CR=1 FL=1